MIKRKKNLLLIQLTLFILGTLIIFYTYYDRNSSDENLISSESQKQISEKMKESSGNNDIFYNIKYSGIDLAGNRYILTSKEAITDTVFPEIVNMKFLEATFFFKDETTLSVTSKEGVYNNKTLDMMFEKDVKAFYEGSELFAEKADYSNSKGLITILENVTVKDYRGTLLADKLLFDLKKQNLQILSYNDNKINAKVEIKWKKVLEF